MNWDADADSFEFFVDFIQFCDPDWPYSDHEFGGEVQQQQWRPLFASAVALRAKLMATRAEVVHRIECAVAANRVQLNTVGHMFFGHPSFSLLAIQVYVVCPIKRSAFNDLVATRIIESIPSRATRARRVTDTASTIPQT